MGISRVGSNPAADVIILTVAQLEVRGTVNVLSADIPRSLVRILPVRFCFYFVNLIRYSLVWSGYLVLTQATRVQIPVAEFLFCF